MFFFSFLCGLNLETGNDDGHLLVNLCRKYKARGSPNLLCQYVSVNHSLILFQSAAP